MISIINSTPVAKSRSVRVPAVSVSVIGTGADCAITGPVSMPLSRRITETPVTDAPSLIAVTTGLGPLYRGSRDG